MEATATQNPKPSLVQGFWKEPGAPPKIRETPPGLSECSIPQATKDKIYSDCLQAVEGSTKKHFSVVHNGNVVETLCQVTGEITRRILPVAVKMSETFYTERLSERAKQEQRLIALVQESQTKAKDLEKTVESLRLSNFRLEAEKLELERKNMHLAESLKKAEVCLGQKRKLKECEGGECVGENHEVIALAVELAGETIKKHMAEYLTLPDAGDMYWGRI